jgi:ferredoxin-NADP reductase
VLLLAGGIGVTPLRSLFETLSAQPGDLTMIYRASTELDVVFRRELDAIAQWRDARVVYLVGPPGSDADPFVGRRLASIVPDLSSHDIYLCGPPRMMDAAHSALRRLGVRRRQIHAESFEF